MNIINSCDPSFFLSTVHRGRPVLHSALCVQEEGCEAHCHCDAAGGPARYEHTESLQTRAEVTD